MKKSLRFLFFCMPLFASGQSAVGTSTPDPSAKFEVYSTTQGFLPPRVALTGTGDVTTIKKTDGTAVTPATGLMVYNTATAGTGSTAVTPGYYAFSGSSWDRMASQPVSFVNGTPYTYRTTPEVLIAGNDQTGYTRLGTITLPPGKWDVAGEFACVINAGGSLLSGDYWYLHAPYNAYWLSEKADGIGGIAGFDFPPAFSASEVTTDGVVTGGAVTILPLGQMQKMRFIINNAGATSKTYQLRTREAYGGLNTQSNDGSTNSYYDATNLNRFYAVKIH